MKPTGVVLVATFFSLVSAGQRSWADVVFRGGPRIGLEFHDDADLVMGADVRFSFSRSPLTINPIFDYYVDEDRTLFQLGLNALYHVPIPTELFSPYAGVGVGVTAFSYRDDVPTDDDNGSRVGLNLVGGACFDLPVVTPFVQTMVSSGEIDLVTIGGGLLFGFGGDGRSWDSCGRRLHRGGEAGPSR